MKILGIFAHDDDGTAQFGGLMTRLVDAGHEVKIVICTPAKWHLMRDGRSDLDVRIQESFAAYNVVGIAPRNLDFFEQELEVTRQNRERFKLLVESEKPDAVFTHWPADTNPDHRAVAALVLEPCLLRGVNIELFCIEVFSAVGRPQSLGFFPSHYVDVSQQMTIEKKREMVFCHHSQNPNEILVALDELERTRGSEFGVPLAEALIRLTRYGELNPELATIIKPSPFKLPRPMGIKVDPKTLGLAP